MEWVVGDSPTDLLTRSTGNAVDHGFAYTEKKKLEARKNLLDLVSISYFFRFIDSSSEFWTPGSVAL